jgi:hypothetical protein
VRAPVRVRAHVARRELAAAEDRVRLGLLLGRERLVDLARVDEQRRARVGGVALEVGDLEPRGVRDDGDVRDVLEGEVEGVARCGGGCAST